METLPNQPSPSSPTRLFKIRYLLLATFILVLSYAVFDRSLPIENMKTTVLNKPLPGQDVVMNVDLDRTKVCHTKTQRTVFDGTGTKFPGPINEYQVVGNVGHDSYNIRIPVHPDAEPGQGFVRFVSVWVCNYVHIIWPVIYVNDIPFEIVRPT